MVWDALKSFGKKAGKKAKEYDQKMVESTESPFDEPDSGGGSGGGRYENDPSFPFGGGGGGGQRGGSFGFGGGGGGSQSNGGGETLNVVYSSTFDEWAVDSDSRTLKTEDSREAAEAWARQRVNNPNSKFDDYVVTGGTGQRGGGGGMGLF